MNLRNKDGYQTHLTDFLKYDILVICPKCSGKAIVHAGNFPIPPDAEHAVKLTCSACGYNKRLSEHRESLPSGSSVTASAGRHYIFGDAIDPFFFVPLWLKTDFEQHTLWAYNFEHLDFLRRHLEARHRERNGLNPANRSMGSRLPKWMTAQKHRAQILKKLDELQKG
ncbi:MAG: hypothetical protein IT266_00065 [Saprospiraceae bacterium]|nr:hypothetical protein [Saprospiraceae bacterium]